MKLLVLIADGTPDTFGVSIIKSGVRIDTMTVWLSRNGAGIPSSIITDVNLEWEGDKLVIDGCAFVPSVDITKRRHASKIVVLMPRNRRRPPIVLPAQLIAAL